MATPSFVQAQTAINAADDAAAAKAAAEAEESWKYSVVRPSQLSGGGLASDPAGPLPAGREPRKPSKGRKLALLMTGVLMTGGIIAGTIGAMQYMRPRSDVAAPTPSAPAAQPAVVEQVTATQPATAVGDAENPSSTDAAVVAKPEPPKPPPEDPKPVVVQRASLTVTAFPWGNVWVNDKPMGRAPLTNKKVAPGNYKVSAGRKKPEKTRTVKLRPGQREVIDFDLTQ
jgi:hypothetical protein